MGGNSISKGKEREQDLLHGGIVATPPYSSSREAEEGGGRKGIEKEDQSRNINNFTVRTLAVKGERKDTEKRDHNDVKGKHTHARTHPRKAEGK